MPRARHVIIEHSGNLYTCGHSHKDHAAALPCTRRARARLAELGVDGAKVRLNHIGDGEYLAAPELHPALTLESRWQGASKPTAPESTVSTVLRDIRHHADKLLELQEKLKTLL